LVRVEDRRRVRKRLRSCYRTPLQSPSSFNQSDPANHRSPSYPNAVPSELRSSITCHGYASTRSTLSCQDTPGHSLPARLYYSLSFNLTYSSFIFLFLDQTHIHSFACDSAIHTLSQRIPTLPIYLLFPYLYRLVTTTLDPSNVTVVTVIGKYIKPSRVVHSSLALYLRNSPLTYRLADQVSKRVVYTGRSSAIMISSRPLPQ
jgi:hypothetical protein